MAPYGLVSVFLCVLFMLRVLSLGAILLHYSGRGMRFVGYALSLISTFSKAASQNNGFGGGESQI